MSGNFLVQILNDLRRAGLVESRRGKTGGYLLARPPGLITLAQVVEAVDPGLVQCSVSRDGESGTGVRQAWEGVSKASREAMERITLESLASNSTSPMFYI